MLAYDYRAGSARLDDLPEVPISPHLYVLCDRCAGSLRPPRGWVLDDRRGKGGRETDERPPKIGAVEVPVPAAAEAAPIEERQRQLAFGYSA